MARTRMAFVAACVVGTAWTCGAVDGTMWLGAPSPTAEMRYQDRQYWIDSQVAGEGGVASFSAKNFCNIKFPSGLTLGGIDFMDGYQANESVAFGGADVLMTSFTLAKGAEKSGPYDLVVCGKQTTDGDTAQVGAEMAEWMGIPHVANVKSIDAVGKDALSATVDLPDCTLAERIPYPCLITVEKGIFEPRLPSYKLMKATADREIAWLGLKDLDDTDPKHYGLNGSPTQVKRIFPPESHVEHVHLEGNDVEKAAQLADLLEKRKFLQ